MAWACRACNKVKADERAISDYTRKLLHAHTMQVAGYPFDKNDFTPEEWVDLAKVKTLYQRR